MKKNMMEKISSLLLAAAMVFGVSVTAFAAVPTITFRGKDNFEVTSDNLFVDFNNVMPGDTLTQQVIFENQARDSDYIEVYLKAVPKASDANTSTEKEFLSELELTVKNGNTEIFKDSPDKAGNLTNGVYLGRLRNGQKVTLDLELTIPIELDNKYADCLANAVDWVFTVSGFDDETTPGGGGGSNNDRDDTTTIGDEPVPLTDRPTVTIDDEDVPLNDLPDDTVTIDDGEVPLKNVPDTGDIIPVTAMAAAALSLCGIIALNRKKK